MELIVSLPEVALESDQLPEAVQELAFVEDQVSCAEPLSATVLGTALRETVGAGVGGGGGALVPPPSGAAPPPQAARPSANSNPTNEL